MQLIELPSSSGDSISERPAHKTGRSRLNILIDIVQLATSRFPFPIYDFTRAAVLRSRRQEKSTSPIARLNGEIFAERYPTENTEYSRNSPKVGTALRLTTKQLARD
jgi:hypothetical protein